MSQALCEELPDLESWIAEYRREQTSRSRRHRLRRATQLEEIREDEREAAEAERTHVCHECPVRKEHRTYRRTRARLLIDHDAAERRLKTAATSRKHACKSPSKGSANVLVQFNYLRKGELTYKARKLADIFDTTPL